MPQPRVPIPFAACCVILACSSGDTGVTSSAPQARGLHSDPSYTPRRALDRVGAVALDTYREFAGKSAELARVTEAYAVSLEPGDRELARAAFVDAMLVWQRAELFRFGPAGDSSTPGGMGIGDEIYSWAVSANPCRVDQETSADDHADPAAAALKAINVRGLDALEYLLFAPDSSNRCSSGLALNAQGAWALIEPVIEQRRARHAAALTVDLQERARALVAQWESEQGGFWPSLGEASAYRSEREAFSAVVGATLYLDTQTKDRKLGAPAGLRDCESDTCPEALESGLAGLSRQNVRANLDAFRLLLGPTPSQSEGGQMEGFGLADQLEDVGAGDVAVALRRDVDAALDAVDAIAPQSLAEALTDNLAAVREAYSAVKEVTDRLKGELVTELGLELTQPGAGDAD